ncbi:unnamed protein product [Calypogeia fissa]
MSTAFRSTMVPSSSARYFMSLYKILRLAFVCAFMLLAVLVFVLHGFNHAMLPKTRVAPKIFSNQSPLQVLLSKEHALQEEFRESDCEMLKMVNHQSTLELRTIVIAETVVPYEDRKKLADFVSKQLEASDTLTYLQASAIITMVNLAPMQASVFKEETGQSGTLRNSAALALIKRQLNNIHFMMIGIRAEPRLGWRWISSSERNSWNNMLSRLVATKIRVEAQNYLWQSNEGERPSAMQAKVENNLALQQLLPESFNV